MLIPPLLLSLLFAALFFTRAGRFASPFVQLAGFAFLPFCLKPVVHTVFNLAFLFPLQPEVVAAAMSYFVAYVTVGFVVGALLISSRALRRVVPRRRTYGPEASADNVFALNRVGQVAAYALPILAFVALRVAGIEFSNPLAVRRFLSTNGMFYLLQPVFFLSSVIASRLAVDVFVRHRVRASQLVQLTLYLFISWRSGYSGFLITIVWSMLTMLSTYKRRLIWPALCVITPVCIIHAIAYLNYRNEAIGSETATYQASLIRVFEDPSTMTLALNRLDQFESLVQGHSYLNNVAPDYGLSMANVATLMIPRAWWEGKARNFSSMMTEQIRNQVYATGSTANFNSFNEFKRAFGDIGAVFFGGMILGLLLALLYTVYARCEGNNQLSLFYTTVLVMPFITGFSAGFFNEAALPMFCINLACYKLLVSSEGATRGKHSTADGMRMVGPLIGSRAFSLAAGAR